MNGQYSEICDNGHETHNENNETYNTEIKICNKKRKSSEKCHQHVMRINERRHLKQEI
jgi:hypothetical protein